jgi:NAD(P)-dependent dehydrogenase (short-subunit alcohol dehydrogenase family)
MPLIVLTGASRGLGLGIARCLIEAGQPLLTLQRTPNPDLEALAAARRAALTQWAVDLTDPGPVADRLSRWLKTEGAEHAPRGVTLINNAAVLAPPGELVAALPADLCDALRASLEAPLVLTAVVLAATAAWTGKRRVLNISSGLGRYAMAGAASYCAAKAGLDHFSRAVALEEAAKPNGARIVSLAPGVIDTDMQVQLRSADPALFGERTRFEQMKLRGGLDSIDAAAAKVVAYLAREDFGHEVVADVRQG